MKNHSDCPICPNCSYYFEETIVLYKPENAICSEEVIVNGIKMTVDRFREEKGEYQKKNKNFEQWKK